jgi:molybdenum cofactor cytidylyltransferase
MKFGSVAVEDALGCVLAHSVKLNSWTLKKGKVLSQVDIDSLLAENLQHVIAAKLDASDVPEDEAARQLSIAISGENATTQEAFTGRANLYTNCAGVLLIDETRLRQINHLHESLTIATLPEFARVNRRDMLATVKIIPFATPREVLEKALNIVGDRPLVSVAAFKSLRVALFITRLPQTKDSIVVKSETAIRDRVTSLGGSLTEVVVCDHAQDVLAHEIRKLKNIDLILLFGASAIVDRADVVPAALVEAGGLVKHIGMPVDPGNLLMLGALNSVPVIGVPSCARSPKTNGFDWVLQRLMAGIDVSPSDLMAMGAGGLLAEIKSRPQPREGQTSSMSAPRIAAVVLAAGLSSRMGSNKLLSNLNGQALIVHTIERLSKAAIDDIIVVTGHQADEVQAELKNHKLRFVHNDDYAQGLSTSVRVGIASAQDFDAAFVCLGDMPLIEAADLNRMIAAFNVVEGRSLVAPVLGRKLGNPVLWGQEHFVDLMALTGDRGARSLIEARRDQIVEIAVTHDGILLDADTPEALAEIRAKLKQLPILQKA